jgi:hypothetical protein
VELVRAGGFRTGHPVPKRSEPAATGPDFNAIEQALAKLKAFLRAARPRRFEQVVELVAVAIGLFTSQECANFVRHCDYRVATAL